MDGPAPQLLERERELQRIEALLEQASSGASGLLLIEGPSGIGKTELVRASMRLAGARGMSVLRARGGELECELPFGIVLQLLEAPPARTPDRRPRATPSPGAAEEALRATNGGRGPASNRHESQRDEQRSIESLYRLLGELSSAGAAPLLIAVDDVHWADEPSLRWLSYVAQRLEKLPLALVLGRRQGEPREDLRALDLIAVQPATEIIRPQPLSQGATAQLVREISDDAVDEDFCTACWDVTGGNPFFARELLASVEADGIPTTAEGAPRVRRLTSEGIRRSVINRLGRLGSDARQLARTLAVLGSNVPLRLAAQAAGLSQASASAAADELARGGFLARGRPLDFIHPIARTTLYEDMHAGERSTRHRTAADILARDGAALKTVARHLLLTEPAGDERVVVLLVQAAREQSGLTATEIAYLRRALAEPPGAALRPTVLAQLGEAELAALDSQAIEHLLAAVREAGDPLERARVVLSIGRTVGWFPGSGEMRDRMREAIAELKANDLPREAREIGLLLSAQDQAAPAAEHAKQVLHRRLWDRASPCSNPSEAVLLASLAYLGIFSGRTAEEVAGVARRVLTTSNGTNRHASPMFRYTAIRALQFAGGLEEAETAMRSELDRAQEQRSPVATAHTLVYLGHIAWHRGRLATARELSERAGELAAQLGIRSLESMSAVVLAVSLIERGDLACAARVLEAMERPGGEGSVETPPFAGLHLFARGRLMLAQGRPDGALDSLRRAGRRLREVDHDHPAYCWWRSEAALAELLTGNTSGAVELAEEELAVARQFGAPIPVGRALRVLGLARNQLDLLHQAVDTLGDAHGELELARAHVDLGAALRRAGQRSDARKCLRHGLDMAQTCGALLLSEQARTELASLGVRLRRSETAGLDQLTPGERRVALMAAEGLSNREIAQRLFLTLKTVEKHLGQAYLKLDISSRRDLPTALATGG